MKKTSKCKARCFSIFLLFSLAASFASSFLTIENVSAQATSGFSFNEVAISESSLYVYDGDGYLVDSLLDGNNWIKYGYPSLEYAFGQPVLCDENGSQVDKLFYLNNDNIITTKQVGNVTYHFRRFYYFVDVMVRTKVYLGSIDDLPKKYIQFDGINPGNLSGIGESNDGWDPDAGLHSLIVIDERAPPNRWWSQSLDMAKWDGSPGSAAVQGSNFKLPYSGTKPDTMYMPNGDYVSVWRSSYHQQGGSFGGSPQGIQSFDYPKIWDQYGGRRMIAEPRIIVKLAPFLDGSYELEQKGGKVLYNLQDKSIGIYGATIIDRPYYGRVGNDLNESVTEKQWSQEMERLFGKEDPYDEKSFTVTPQYVVSMNAPNGYLVQSNITYSAPVTHADTFALSAATKGTSLKMYYGGLENEFEFNSDLELAKGVPSTAEIRPRFTIQPEFIYYTMDISAKPEYYGYYNPTTDPTGNLYYTKSDPVRYVFPSQTIQMTNRVRVENTFVISRIRFEVIAGAKYTSTWIPYSSGVEIDKNITDRVQNDVMINTPTLDTYKEQATGTDPYLVALVFIIIIIAAVSIIVPVLYFSDKKKKSAMAQQKKMDGFRDCRR